jgi:hypothetical protein
MPLLVAACALGAAMVLAQGLVSRERQQLQGRTDAEAKYVAAQLRTAVLQSMDVLPRIGNWWLSQGRPEAREDWETDAQLFLQAGTGLRELVWIDTNGKTLWSVRPGAVPDFKKHYSPDAELAVTVRQAQQNGALTLSNVANRNSVPHFYACVPIRSGRLVGFVAGLFDAAALSDTLLSEQVPRDYEVTIAVDGLRVTTLTPARSPLWRGGSRTADLKVANRRWSAQLVPAATDIQTLQRAVWSFGVCRAAAKSRISSLLQRFLYPNPGPTGAHCTQIPDEIRSPETLCVAIVCVSDAIGRIRSGVAGASATFGWLVPSVLPGYPGSEPERPPIASGFGNIENGVAVRHSWARRLR